MRSIPTLQSLHSKAEIVIIGDAMGKGYGPTPEAGTWKDRFMQNKNSYDPTKVHFVGCMDRSNYLKILQAAGSCNLRSFVVSWSLPK